PHRTAQQGGVRMRPVFCGNFDYETRQSDLERLFSKYGPIRRIDMKSGYAFVYFQDERDAEDAIRRLSNAEFGHTSRRLSVEWSRVTCSLCLSLSLSLSRSLSLCQG
uniref:RRM domain-containing protein n=1 Tax=Aegilops tauschii subsp. strangulata TaxID=200361 RepID=A0A453JEP3_AEGTS